MNNSLFPEKIANAKNESNNNNVNDNDNRNHSSSSSSRSNSSNDGIFPYPKSSYPDSTASQDPLQLQLQQGEKHRIPKILPLKSFRNNLFDLNVFVHSF